MSFAARILDASTHGGVIVGPGAPTVLVGGMPAAVAGDQHVCPIPPPAHAPTASPFPVGSATVTIEGKPALRAGDLCACGAAPLPGEPTVLIG